MKAVKDSVIYLAGELISKAMPFLLLPYLSRKLGVEGYGELSYYQTYLVLFPIFLGLSQDGAIARYFYFYGKRSLNLVLISGYSYTFVIGSIALLICWIYHSEIMAYIILSAIFQTLLNVQLSIRQCQKKAMPYTFIQLLSGITTVVLTIILFECFGGDLVEKRVLAVLFSNLITFFIAYFLYVKKEGNMKLFNINKYKLGMLYIFSFGFPLVFHHISLFLRGQLDRIFIYHKFSEAELGLYAMGSTFALILNILIQAVNKATLPYYFEGLKGNKITHSKIYKFFGLSLLVIPIPSLFVWFIPEDLILWVIGKEYIGIKYYITFFLITSMLTIPYLILVNYLFYLGLNKIISFCSVLTTVIYILTLFFLINTKIEYVPLSSILSSIFILPILGYYVKKYR